MNARDIVVSPDLRSVSRNTHTNGGFYQNIMTLSTHATDDFTVRISNQLEPSTPIPGNVFIGFTSRAPSTFKPDMMIYDSDGAYTLKPCDGELWGSGSNGTSYCAGFTEGTVRCVADRGRETIAFTVDGVECGTAWVDVESEPLHAFVVFVFHGVTVEFV